MLTLQSKDVLEVLNIYVNAILSKSFHCRAKRAHQPDHNELLSFRKGDYIFILDKVRGTTSNYRPLKSYEVVFCSYLASLWSQPPPPPPNKSAYFHTIWIITIYDISSAECFIIDFFFHFPCPCFLELLLFCCFWPLCVASEQSCFWAFFFVCVCVFRKFPSFHTPPQDEEGESGWYQGELNGKTGWFPSDHVSLLIEAPRSGDGGGGGLGLLQKWLAWALFVVLLSTLVCYISQQSWLGLFA